MTWLVNVRYNHSIVAYIDILGFKRTIESTPIKSTWQIAKRLDTFRRALSWRDMWDNSVFRPTPKPEVLLFSDLALYVWHVDPKDDNEIRRYFMTTVFDLASFCVEMIEKEGIFVRGGVTEGNIYLNNIGEQQMAFGPAFIKAYYLESHANYPRIVIDPELLKRLELSLKASKGGTDDWHKYLRYALYKKGRKSSINYLYYYYKSPTGLSTIKDILKRHQDLIQEMHSQPKLKDKYIWMKEYHNAFINQVNDKALEDYCLN